MTFSESQAESKEIQYLLLLLILKVITNLCLLETLKVHLSSTCRRLAASQNACQKRKWKRSTSNSEPAGDDACAQTSRRGRCSSWNEHSPAATTRMWLYARHLPLGCSCPRLGYRWSNLYTVYKAKLGYMDGLISHILAHCRSLEM